MDRRRGEVLHRPDLLGCGGLGQDCGPQRRWVQLAQSGFMTMVGLLLGNQDEIGFGDMGEILNAGGLGVAREHELGMPDGRWARQPWIDEDGEGAWRLIEET